jgi:hypothetical protein
MLLCDLQIATVGPKILRQIEPYSLFSNKETKDRSNHGENTTLKIWREYYYKEDSMRR